MNDKVEPFIWYIFHGLVFGFFIALFIAVFVNITHNDKDRDESTHERDTVYLDGVEVDSNKIIVEKYDFLVDDEN